MKYIYVLLASLTIVSCQKKADQAGVIDDKQVVIDSMKMEMVKQKTIDSMKIELAKQQEVQAASSKEVIVVNQAAPAPARKKWSSTAKGAVIGAGVGAATGAIISKKKGTGAIIGGLAGAGVGAGTGAIIDGKKN
ncbi:YMGG-like glycine zipper-containing protein [Flavobacterium sp.]|uniref:YMGG-like glycine zipper-containing protein n=1 Tax=Flavobacterium sp. TaxID=239 RepID=UPI00262E678D|nr:YMGG-like glycine zipper-containing protein [Flavobacterium sp.]MDG2432896.1 glycine zipper family protein [Flavobacterium sp.]